VKRNITAAVAAHRTHVQAPRRPSRATTTIASGTSNSAPGYLEPAASPIHATASVRSSGRPPVRQRSMRSIAAIANAVM
jgi:hypothetical protein